MGYHGQVVVSRIRALRTDIYMLDVCFYLIKSCYLNRYQCFGDCLYLRRINCLCARNNGCLRKPTNNIYRPHCPDLGTLHRLHWWSELPCPTVYEGPHGPESGGLRSLTGGTPSTALWRNRKNGWVVKRVLVLVLLMAKDVMAEQGTAIMTASRNILMMMVTTTTVITLMI